MNPHAKALDSMIGDMDDFETKKMFPEENKGVSITISVSPQGEIAQESEGEEALMNKGGMADCYSEGGVVPHKGGTRPMPELEADIHSGYDKGKDPHYEKGEMGMNEGGFVEDMSLPPFLRKKKKGTIG